MATDSVGCHVAYVCLPAAVSLSERVGQSLISICGDMRVISLILKLSFHQYLPSAFAILFQTKQHAHRK